MALDDRIRTAVDAALSQLGARIEDDVRALIREIEQVAAQERAATVAAARQALADEVQADTRRQIEEAEARTGAARIREREAGIAALARLLESIRNLDASSSLTEVLDALGAAAGREASRAAVFVSRNERLQGWKLSGFGSQDVQPKAIDLGLTDSGVLGLAVTSERDVPSGRPEIMELLARHAARCLEALTVQKAAASSPRFWLSGPAAPAGSDAPPGMNA